MRILPSLVIPALLFLALLQAVPVFAAAQDIGKVIAYTPGATVLRDGKTEALALHAGIRVSDLIRTDASGRVRILFNDDSSVSLGPDTSVDMSAYADTGNKPAFALGVSQGLVRTVTGKIVDRNPGGFKITTPVATVGIRGTISSTEVDEEKTIVAVESTTLEVVVNGVKVFPGKKMIVTSKDAWQESITPKDRRRWGQLLALKGGKGSAAAAPEPGGDDGQSTTAWKADSFSTDTFKDCIDLNFKLNDSLLSNLVLSKPLMGHVSGSVNSSTWGSINSGSAWGFDVNLFNGRISNGFLNYSSSMISVSFTGGMGLATSMGFLYSGIGTVTNMSLPSSAPVSVSGSTNLLSAPSGSTVGMNYKVDGLDSGAGSGTFTK